MTPGLEEPFNHNQQPSPGSETYILDQAMERVRKEKRNLYSKHPNLLVSEIQKIADDFPDIILHYGKSYFMAFTAGVLAEKYGFSIVTANQAVKAWNAK